MNDNKLKIRIQIQQPTKAIEQIYPGLPEPEITYEQSPDWRKISIAALLLVSVLALGGYFLSGSSKNDMPSKAAAPTGDAHKTPAEETKPESGSKDNTAETPSGPLLSEHNDSAGLIQPAETDREIRENAASTIEPAAIISQPAVTGKKIPKTATQSKPQKPSDHPLVYKAQLSSAIKALEPVDAIDTIQLRQGESRPVYFYLHLKNLQGKTVSVAWYHNQKPDSQLALQIHDNNWRTYASKQLDHQRLGAWRVELTDESGNRLAVRNFTVTKR